ncbi:hypothetical protein LIER_37463 [Lithospermum erythrorhizon]|uniref:Uncharacterized protein n=1 Tax=Lithospermum erythrorhizon TaxID=34254 RepID=A0AAV3PKT2_LITER
MDFVTAQSLFGSSWDFAAAQLLFGSPEIQLFSNKIIEINDGGDGAGGWAAKLGVDDESECGGGDDKGGGLVGC